MENSLIFDFVIIALIVISAIFAFSRGFSQEIFSLISWVSAFFISYFFAHLLFPIIVSLIGNQLISKFVSYFLVFIFFLFFLSYLTKKFSNSIKKSTVGMLDRSLGFIFGIFRGYVIISLIFFAFMTFYSEKIPKWLDDSKMNYLLMIGSIKIVSLFDKENISTKILENKISKKSKQLFEKSIDSHIRRKDETGLIEGYKKNERENLQLLIESVE